MSVVNTICTLFLQNPVQFNYVRPSKISFMENVFLVFNSLYNSMIFTRDRERDRKSLDYYFVVDTILYQWLCSIL